MESTDISLQLKALQEAIQNINNSNNGYAEQNKSQARQITSPVGKPVYGTEGTAPYVPFAPGTPTLAAQQFAESQMQNAIANQMNQAKYNLSAAREGRIASGGGGSGGRAPKLTATQKKNDLLGSMTSFVKQKATAGTPFGEAVNIIWDNMDETDRQTLSLADVQSQVKRIYELNGIDVSGGGSGSGGAGGELQIIPGFLGGSGDTANKSNSNGSSEEAPYTYAPFVSNAQGNFASPFDQVITGNKQTIKNLPWYMR